MPVADPRGSSDQQPATSNWHLVTPPLQWPHMPIAERVCLALLLVYLFWLPLPFGSVIDEARLPLVVTPLLLCFAAALLAARDPATSFGMAYRTWSIGGALLVMIAALQ